MRLCLLRWITIASCPSCRDQRWQALCAAQLEALQAEHVAPASWAFQLVVMLTVVARDCPFLVGPAFAAVLQRMVHSSQVRRELPLEQVARLLA